jgi:hypothetical protein
MVDLLLAEGASEGKAVGIKEGKGAKGFTITPSFLDAQREGYQVYAQREYGSLVNPITGDEEDIMDQCVNLTLETGEGGESVADEEAYNEVLSTFAFQLPAEMKVWTEVQNSMKQGVVNCFHAEDDTLDFRYTVKIGDREKTHFKKDIPRDKVKTQPVLVFGDPSAGKTTFAFQLITWVMRHDEHKRLIPILVRTVDLVRQAANDIKRRASDFMTRQESLAVSSPENMILKFLQSKDPVRYHCLLKPAYDQGRLLVVLDGFDEAGGVEEQLTREISHMVEKIMLVVTSRRMQGVFDKPEFNRFRHVFVKALDGQQQKNIIRKRLSPIGNYVQQLVVENFPCTPSSSGMTALNHVLRDSIKAWKHGEASIRQVEGPNAMVELLAIQGISVPRAADVEQPTTSCSAMEVFLRDATEAHDRLISIIFPNIASMRWRVGELMRHDPLFPDYIDEVYDSGVKIVHAQKHSGSALKNLRNAVCICFHFDTVDKLRDARMQLQSLDKLHVKGVENRYLHSNRLGWGDVRMLVRVPIKNYSSHHVCEIQLHHTKFVEARHKVIVPRRNALVKILEDWGVRNDKLEEAQQFVVDRLSEKDADSAKVSNFLEILKLNSALAQMASNPLLLNVTLSVYNTCCAHGNHSSLNRGLVYKYALDGMFNKVEMDGGVKDSGIDGGGAAADVLRNVLRHVAFLAHTRNGGEGIRDFTQELVEEAIDVIAHSGRAGNDANFKMEDWDRLVEMFIKKGRFPIIAWFNEGGRDVFRFAHLTFQEFLCAELCKERVNSSRDFIKIWRDLVWGNDGPQSIVGRGWWQQVIQMYCDLARTNDALDAKESAVRSIEVGHSFLNLLAGENHMVEFTGATDTNILTITCLLQKNELVHSLMLKNPGNRWHNVTAKLTSVAVTPLVGALLLTDSIVKLVLSSNKIDPAGGEMIATWLKQKHQVQHLDLQDNLLCMGGLLGDYKKCASDLAPYANTISVCSYSANLTGITALIEAVDGHPSLRHFDLRGNGFGCESARTLIVSLESNAKKGIGALDFVCGIDVAAMKTKDELCDFKGAAAPLESGGTLLLAYFLEKYKDTCQLNSIDLSAQWSTFDPSVVNLHNNLDLPRPHHFHNTDGIEMLANFLEGNTSVTSLNFGARWDLTAAGGYALGKMLLDNSTLEKITINNMEMSVQSIKTTTSFDAEFWAPMQGTCNWSKGILKDAGAGLVAAACHPDTTVIDLRGHSVSNTGTNYVLHEFKSGRLSHLDKVNGLSLRHFLDVKEGEDQVNSIVLEDADAQLDSAASLSSTVADYGGWNLAPTEASFLIKLLMKKTSLTSIDLSGSWIRPSAFKVSPMIYDINRSAGCDGCSMHYNGAQLGSRSTVIDYDLCDTCARAGSTTADLADLINCCPQLETLKLNNIHYLKQFGG